MLVSSFVAASVSLLALVDAAPSVAPGASSSTPLVGKPNYLFTFGDSYTTTQFDPFGAQPNATNPFGNSGPPLEGWVYYLTAVHNSSLTLSYNYARGGATINQSIVHGNNESLQGQVEQWYLPVAGKHPSTAQWSADNSIAGIFIGINE